MVVPALRGDETLEKPYDRQLEYTMTGETGDASSFEKQMSEPDAQTLDNSQDRRIIRRVDWRVLPWLAILYAWSLIDRTNVRLDSRVDKVRVSC